MNLYCSIKSMSYEKGGKNYSFFVAKNLEIWDFCSIFAVDFKARSIIWYES